MHVLIYCQPFSLLACCTPEIKGTFLGPLWTQNWSSLSWSPKCTVCNALLLQYSKQSYPTKQHWHSISITFNSGLRSHYLGTDKTALFNLQAASPVTFPDWHSRCLVHSICRGWHESGNLIISGTMKNLARSKVQTSAYLHKYCVISVLVRW